MTIRTLTFPFMPADGDWESLGPKLRQAWSMSTRLANWCASELALTDQLTLGKTGELSPFPVTGTGAADPYKAFRGFYPDYSLWKGCTGAATCILQRVAKKYSRERLDVILRNSRSLPSFRYPYPWFSRAQETRAYFGKDNVPLLRVSLPGGNALLRLRGGPEMRRQLVGFRRIVSGEAKLGDVSLYKRGDRYLAGIAASFPNRDRESGVGPLMLVRTDPNALWVVEVFGWTHPRIWNQDHIRSVVKQHRIWLQRVSEDTKREKRIPRKMRRHIDQALADRCRKYHDRIKSFCQEMASELCGLAERLGCAALAYDDEVKTYLEGFNYSLLKTCVRNRLERPDSPGVRFVGRGARLSEPFSFSEEVLEWLDSNDLQAMWSWVKGVQALRPARSSAGKSHPAVSVPQETA